jgi:hypothetical protein
MVVDIAAAVRVRKFCFLIMLMHAPPLSIDFQDPLTKASTIIIIININNNNNNNNSSSSHLP